MLEVFSVAVGQEVDTASQQHVVESADVSLAQVDGPPKRVEQHAPPRPAFVFRDAALATAIVRREHGNAQQSRMRLTLGEVQQQVELEEVAAVSEVLILHELPPPRSTEGRLEAVFTTASNRQLGLSVLPLHRSPAVLRIVNR
jgi:hypothetical protein